MAPGQAPKLSIAYHGDHCRYSSQPFTRRESFHLTDCSGGSFASVSPLLPLASRPQIRKTAGYQTGDPPSRSGELRPGTTRRDLSCAPGKGPI